MYRNWNQTILVYKTLFSFYFKKFLRNVRNNLFTLVIFSSLSLLLSSFFRTVTYKIDCWKDLAGEEDFFQLQEEYSENKLGDISFRRIFRNIFWKNYRYQTLKDLLNDPVNLYAGNIGNSEEENLTFVFELFFELFIFFLLFQSLSPNMLGNVEIFEKEEKKMLEKEIIISYVPFVKRRDIAIMDILFPSVSIFLSSFFIFFFGNFLSLRYIFPSLILRKIVINPSLFIFHFIISRGFPLKFFRGIIPILLFQFPVLFFLIAEIVSSRNMNVWYYKLFSFSFDNKAFVFWTFELIMFVIAIYYVFRYIREIEEKDF